MFPKIVPDMIFSPSLDLTLSTMRLVKSSEVVVLDSTTLMPLLEAMREALIKFNEVAKNHEMSMDVVSGKTISSSKAKVLAEASKEYGDYIRAKVHVENIEQIINAMKSFQRGMLQEWNHMSDI